jgi:hypothetical protein
MADVNRKSNVSPRASAAVAWSTTVENRSWTAAARAVCGIGRRVVGGPNRIAGRLQHHRIDVPGPIRISLRVAIVPNLRALALVSCEFALMRIATVETGKLDGPSMNARSPAHTTSLTSVLPTRRRGRAMHFHLVASGRKPKT